MLTLDKNLSSMKLARSYGRVVSAAGGELTPTAVNRCRIAVPGWLFLGCQLGIVVYGGSVFFSFPQAYLNKLLKIGSKRDRLSEFLLKRLLLAK